MKDVIAIDLDKIHDIAQRGLYRAAIFTGLGINSAESKNLHEYHLSKYTNLRIAPLDVPDSVLLDWKAELSRWITLCGLCEMIDSLALYLDAVYETVVTATRSRGSTPLSAYKRKGLEGKLRELESEFGIRGWHSDKLASFTKVRNCFVHRRGRVGIEDIRSDSFLEIKFLKFESFITTAAGEFDWDLFNPASPQFVAPDGGAQLSARLKDVEKQFSLGELIEFSPRESAEIQFFTRLSIEHHFQSFLAFLESEGVSIVEKKIELNGSK